MKEPATPIPWAIDEDNRRWTYGTPIEAASVLSPGEQTRVALVAGDADDDTTLEQKTANAVKDAEYIIAACNAYPALVDALRAAVAVYDLAGLDGMKAEALAVLALAGAP